MAAAVFVADFVVVAAVAEPEQEEGSEQVFVAVPVLHFCCLLGCPKQYLLVWLF